MRHIFDAEGDPDQRVRTLEADAIHCIVYRFGEEVGLACRVWWVGAMRGERVRQGQGSAKATAVTVTTPTGHVCTLAGQIASLAKLAQRGSRLAAAYFVLARRR